MNKTKLVLLHLLFWGMLFIKSTFLGLSSSGLFLMQMPETGWGLHISVMLCYLSISIIIFYWVAFIVARLFNKNLQWYAKVLMAFTVFIVPVLVRAIVEFAFLKPVIGFDNYAGNKNFSWLFFVPNVLFYYWDIILFGAAYALFMNWRKTERQKQEQAAMHKTAELDFLKSQLNPHFLFNSINDIYALVIKKSDEAPEAIMQLSILLRYALYESNHNEVPLQKEVNYIKTYLDLQKTGYEGVFFVQMKITGTISDQVIAPMLLLPFVENACKHGITNDPLLPVQIELIIADDAMHFKTANHINTMQKDETGGIGLDNIKKRLLLLYPGKHQLVINDDGNNFVVSLTINK